MQILPHLIQGAWASFTFWSLQGILGLVPIDTEETTLYRKGEGRGKKEERMRRGERGGEEKGRRGERRKLYGFLFPTSNHKAELMVGWAPYVPPLYGSSRSEEGKHIHLSGPKEPVKAITTTVLASNSLYYGLEDPLTPNYHLRKEALRSQSYFPGKTGRANKDKNREWGSCLPRLFMTCFSTSFWASAHLSHSEEVYF